MNAPRPTVKHAAVATGTMLGAAVTSAGILGYQALHARRAAGPRRTVPPYADGRYGPVRGVSLRLAMLGDSLAAGLGADYPFQAPGAILAHRLSDRSGRPVTLSTIAVVGSRSDHLALQVQRALITRPNVAVIVIGANDVTHFRPLRRQVRLLRAAILDLRESGVEVVVGTCPDVGVSVLLRPPSRQVANRQSRRLAVLQTRAAVQVGATTVSLGDLLGPEFSTRQLELFAADRFHPNAEGYAALAEVLAPAVLAAAGFGLAGLPERYEPPRTERLNSAIETAVDVPGTVLSPIVHPEPGERRRLATLLQRRRGTAAPADPIGASPAGGNPARSRPSPAEPTA